MPRLGSALTSYSQQITPKNLFRVGEQGFWYDETDFSTMFTDANGNTPIPATLGTQADPFLGLVLDKHSGLQLGAEKIANGGFDVNTNGWSSTGNITIVNGVVHSIPTTNATWLLYLTLSTVVGKRYKISVDCGVLSGSNSGASITAYNTSYVSYSNTTLNNTPNLTTVTSYFTATETSTYIALKRASTATSGEEYIFDNVSVKEVSGNHAYQTVSASRPKLSALYSGIVADSDFSQASWIKSGTCTVTGTNVINLPATNDYIGQIWTTPAPIGAPFTGSIVLSGSGTIHLEAVRSGVGSFELDLISVSLTTTPTRYFVSHSIVNSGQTGISLRIVKEAGDTATQVTAAQADLRYSNDCVGLPVYQRVTSTSDYDAVGFPPRVVYDGVDDCLVSSSIDLTGTDKMTLWCGVRKFSDAARGIVCELSVSDASNNGTFALSAPAGATNTFSFDSKGTTLVSSSQTSVSAPIAKLLTAQGDISGHNNILWSNGLVVDTQTGSQGTGNYGNYALNIGARNGTSLFFKGSWQQLIGRGAQTPDALAAQMNQYVRNKTKIY